MGGLEALPEHLSHVAICGRAGVGVGEVSPVALAAPLPELDGEPQEKDPSAKRVITGSPAPTPPQRASQGNFQLLPGGPRMSVVSL